MRACLRAAPPPRAQQAWLNHLTADCTHTSHSPASPFKPCLVIAAASSQLNRYKCVLYSIHSYTCHKACEREQGNCSLTASSSLRVSFLHVRMFSEVWFQQAALFG